MKASLALQLSSRSQQQFLSGLLDSSWPGDVISCGGFDELRRLAAERRFGLIYLELDREVDDEYLDWIEAQSDPVVGIINRKWEAADLAPYIESGLDDYLPKPFQPDKIIEQVEAYRRLC